MCRQWNRNYSRLSGEAEDEILRSGSNPLIGNLTEYSKKHEIHVAMELMIAAV